MEDCEICSKPFEPKTIRSKVCSRKCHDRRKFLRYTERINAYNKAYAESHREERRDYIRAYQRDYHASTYKRRYARNPSRYVEKEFVRTHRPAIIELIGNVCRECGKPLQEIHHISYLNLPHNDLREYCKFLIPLCRVHHRAKHSRKAQILPKVK